MTHFCRCDVPLTSDHPDLVLSCHRCGLPVECEFSDEARPHAAHLRHVDYFVCGPHEAAAISNVSSRGDNESEREV